MKKNLLILILLIIGVKIGLTQNTNLDYKSALKFYNLTTFEEQIKSRKINDSSYYYKYTNTNLQILHPTIAFQWRSKCNNFHEIELTSIKLGKIGTQTEIINDTTNNSQTISGSDLKSTIISARYEYFLNFNKTKESKLIPSVGFGLNPYFIQNNYLPKVSNVFTNYEVKFGMKTFISPRITYFVTSKIFIDFSLSFCFFDTYYLIDREDNPTLPVNDRTIKTFNYHQFPRVFSGRIGIGLKLLQEK